MRTNIVLLVVFALAASAAIYLHSIVPEAKAAPAPADEVVGVEHVVNPFGDRFIMVRLSGGGGTYGLWVRDECASTLAFGAAWPSSAAVCQP